MAFQSNVRVESDGLYHGTRVTVGGEPVWGITSLKWETKGHDGVPILTLVIEGAEVDMGALHATFVKAGTEVV